ncbi:hypothetical protein DUNSADRAFT_4468 [Dunaliella salina]|uniref:Encoded protein n=1 Tax=Dunaliella salina TaxID=3046 RepID=A0ABQ7GRZ8_DUNSA|nr:hypothetical protein DUNSADRAFT_4468 [Dunaliella salina]|eukprot:KAF5837364.1 hypothetical protein DUNSADRAFT_4468 [Dunaliella salina]
MDFNRSSGIDADKSYYGGGFFYNNPSVHKGGANIPNVARKSAAAGATLPSIHARRSMNAPLTPAAAAATAQNNTTPFISLAVQAEQSALWLNPSFHGGQHGDKYGGNATVGRNA